MTMMSNAAAIGYAILAGKRLGLDKKTIDRIENAMRAEMDERTVEEAEETYRNN